MYKVILSVRAAGSDYAEMTQNGGEFPTILEAARVARRHQTRKCGFGRAFGARVFRGGAEVPYRDWPVTHHPVHGDGPTLPPTEWVEV